ncbi:MAG: SOS response-associated peptidase [Myxococcota bacterium]
MCGRFTLTSTPEALALRFELDAPPELAPRYNVAPTQDVLAIRAQAGRRSARSADWLRWGLVPPWAKDASVGVRMINARIESVTSRSAYREAVTARRCLVAADGFYEWADLGGFKQPYYATPAGGGPIGFAGLWEQWRDPAGRTLETCTILTADATPVLRRVHDRMPVVVDPADHAAWLDPRPGDVDSLLERLGASKPEWRLHPVSPRVNRADEDDASLVAPVPEPPRQEALF